MGSTFHSLHYHAIWSTKQREPFIRTWPDGTPMEADGSRDTLRAADARHTSPAPAPAPEKEEGDDGTIH